MRRPFLVAGLFSLLALGLAAQVVYPQYQAWMKSMQPSLMAIRNAPDKAAMVDAANKLAATFDQVAMYWKAKQTADAVGFAETARDAAKAIAAGSGEKVANLEKIEQQCGACHQAHRFQRGGDNDPDRAVRGGSLPEGWSVRPDRGTADQIKFTIAGDVYHFAMGPAGTFYRSDWTKSGDYQFSARLTQMKAPTHPISYGLMIGGSDLAGPNQTYSYFLVRNQGEYYVANREADKRPTAVVTWTAHPVIVKEGADGRQTNSLGIRVQGDDVIFIINGTEVTKLAKSKLHTDGMYGFRIGHNLDVDVDQVKR
jgi:mono/diheme cytochrome c family protein